MPAPITPADITAATAGPGPVDVAALERCFNAFALYPAGDGLSGFDGPDHMLTAFTDGICRHLAGDYNQPPEPVVDALLDFARNHHGSLPSFTFTAGADLAIARWQGFRERFAA